MSSDRHGWQDRMEIIAWLGFVCFAVIPIVPLCWPRNPPSVIAENVLFYVDCSDLDRPIAWAPESVSGHIASFSVRHKFNPGLESDHKYFVHFDTNVSLNLEVAGQGGYPWAGPINLDKLDAVVAGYLFDWYRCEPCDRSRLKDAFVLNGKVYVPDNGRASWMKSREICLAVGLAGALVCLCILCVQRFRGSLSRTINS